MSNPGRLVILVIVTSVFVLSSDASCHSAEPAKPVPTQADIRYGTHERNVLDFWKSPESARGPLVLFVHGGGFREGSKERLSTTTLNELLAAGVSVAAINYRFREHAPLPGAHYDARRALQFLRSKADEWQFDKSRIGAFGSSAGAQICMYLAFHDELANPSSSDLVERESTRLKCVGTIDGQTTMDVDWWLKNIPGYDRAHQDFPMRFGLTDRSAYLAVVADTSGLSLISADDPPIYMTYSMQPDAPLPPIEKRQGWQIHHVQFGVALKQKMDALHVESHLVYPGISDPQDSSLVRFLIAKLSTSEAAGQ